MSLGTARREVVPRAHHFLENSFAFLAFCRAILLFSGGGKSACTRLAHRLLVQQTGNGAAHEGAHKIIGGAVQNLFGSAELREAAALREDGDCVAEQKRLINIVGDEHDRLGEASL